MAEDLAFRYYMKISFASPVKDHYFSLRCIPAEDERQKISDLEIKAEPCSYIENEKDAYGNIILYGAYTGEIESFMFDISGIAHIDAGARVHESSPVRAAVFKYETPLTKAGENIVKYYKKLVCDREDNAGDHDHAGGGSASDGTAHSKKRMSDMEWCLLVMHSLNRDLTYAPGSTWINTTAEEAMAKRSGVCQDYSHIMLSLLRLRGISCRYVTGMIEGEGRSHAWVEALINGVWEGFDPTNDVVPSGGHVRIGCGRDYSDCLINRGIFKGMPAQQQDVDVCVRKLCGKQ